MVYHSFVKVVNYDISVYACYFMSAIAVRYDTVGRGGGLYNVWVCCRLRVARRRRMILG